MGNQVSLVPKVSYEDIQMIVYRNTHVPHTTLLINTLPTTLQHCLIKTTIDIRFEETVINNYLIKNRNVMIIVYGKNSNDITILHKYEQLVKLGFTNVHIYTGGIFEWMLLHEIYGKDLFKITRYEIDILRYRPKSVLLAAMTIGRGGGGAGIGHYLEDTSSHNDDDNYDHNNDVRINIPASEDNSVNNGGSSGDGPGDGAGGGSFLSGLKWLFTS
jgi:hypothetical protein